MKHIIIFRVFILGFSLFAHPTFATTIAMSFSGASAAPVTGLPDDITVGWSFTTKNSKLRVTSVGFYDHAGDHTLADSHRVAIFTAGGDNLGESTISSASNLVDSFLYEPLITSIILNANTTYNIGALMPSANDIVIGKAVADPDDKIIYGEARYALNIFSSPDLPFSSNNDGFFGPNFQFETVASVPAPNVMMLLLSGIGFIAYRKRAVT